MNNTLILIMTATFLATLVGGLFALKLKDRLHLILGFSAGAILGVAFFDLIPEALNLTVGFYSISNVLAVTVVGFCVYLILDRMLLLHEHDHSHESGEGEHENHDGHNHNRGSFGAGSLSLHSFLDGMGIGLAFHVSMSVGAVVAVAVLVHDFSDGINTVSFILKNGGQRLTALKWLIVDSVAPVLGVVATFFFSVPAEMLGVLLALFAGFFLYIGASDLIPESYHNHPVKWTTFATIFGMVLIYIVVNIAGV